MSGQIHSPTSRKRSFVALRQAVFLRAWRVLPGRRGARVVAVTTVLLACGAGVAAAGPTVFTAGVYSGVVRPASESPSGGGAKPFKISFHYSGASQRITKLKVAPIRLGCDENHETKVATLKLTGFPTVTHANASLNLQFVQDHGHWTTNRNETAASNYIVFQLVYNGGKHPDFSDNGTTPAALKLNAKISGGVATPSDSGSALCQIPDASATVKLR
jgi:hypothetical protein